MTPQPETTQDNSAAFAAGGVEPWAPVAAGGTDNSAAVAAGTQVFDLGFFQGLEVGEHWRNHNAALKLYREQDDNPESWARESWRKFSNTEKDWRAEIDHPRGMQFSFKTDRVQWSWLDMIAQLDEPSMRYVVNGDDSRGSGCGVTECWFTPRPGSYDHALQHANKDAGRETWESSIWDFVIKRADGTGVRLHPQWKTNEIMTFPEEGHWLQVQPPDQGPGHSAGKGTYKMYKELSSQKKLKFAKFNGTRR